MRDAMRVNCNEAYGPLAGGCAQPFPHLGVSKSKAAPRQNLGHDQIAVLRLRLSSRRYHELCIGLLFFNRNQNSSRFAARTKDAEDALLCAIDGFDYTAAVPDIVLVNFLNAQQRAIPHADRIAVSGPDIAVSARAAQSLSLLFFELASHSDEGLSLVGKHPHIVAHWEITGKGSDSIFQFRWEEFNTSQATRRPDSDFGLILLDRVAPEALGGTAKRYFTDVSYVYELTAPMATVVDMTVRDRTEQITAPVRPAR